MPCGTKEEQRKYQREWKAKRRQEWLDANGPCVQCGSSDSLEVDHITPSTKVSHNVWSWSEERRKEELAKCQVLCKKCHGIKTQKENGGPSKHGTWRMYRRYKCRCDKCLELNRKRAASWRNRQTRLPQEQVSERT